MDSSIGDSLIIHFSTLLSYSCGTGSTFYYQWSNTLSSMFMSSSSSNKVCPQKYTGQFYKSKSTLPPRNSNIF